jgi:hypothetical protein
MIRLFLNIVDRHSQILLDVKSGVRLSTQRPYVEVKELTPGLKNSIRSGRLIDIDNVLDVRLNPKLVAVHDRILAMAKITRTTNEEVVVTPDVTPDSDITPDKNLDDVTLGDTKDDATQTDSDETPVNDDETQDDSDATQDDSDATPDETDLLDKVIEIQNLDLSEVEQEIKEEKKEVSKGKGKGKNTPKTK